MISKDQIANIRRLFHAEHWKVGTIASELGLHPETVKRALETDQFKSRARRSLPTDPFLDFIEQTLKQHPRLRATRLFEMLRDRGYQGSVRQLRRVVQNLRPLSKEAFLRLSVLPGEQDRPIGLPLARSPSGVPAAASPASSSLFPIAAPSTSNTSLIRRWRVCSADTSMLFRIGVPCLAPYWSII